METSDKKHLGYDYPLIHLKVKLNILEPVRTY